MQRIDRKAGSGRLGSEVSRPRPAVTVLMVMGTLRITMTSSEEWPATRVSSLPMALPRDRDRYICMASALAPNGVL